MSNNQSRARNRQGFEPAGAGYNDDARNAVNEAFEALSAWRGELSDSADRHRAAAFGKMAAAAKAMGWPAEFVDAARTQMESASKLQLEIIDQVMDVWEQQIKQPGSPFAVPGTLVDSFREFASAREPGRFSGLPDLSAFAANPMQFWMQAARMPMMPMPGLPDMGQLTTNPLAFWMQAAETWQKNWATAVNSWVDAQQAATRPGNRGSR